MGLIDEILSRGNMLEALKAVKQNKGAAGIDKITVGELDEYFKKNWQEIKPAIQNKKYKPQPVRRGCLKTQLSFETAPCNDYNKRN